MKRIPAVLLAALMLSSVAAVAEAFPSSKPAEGSPDQSASQASKGVQGKVVETMDAGGYTYVNVDVNGTSQWAAAPKFKVKKGDTVVVPQGAPMRSFHSKTLNRTFETIYFVGRVEVVEAKEATEPKQAAEAKQNP